jgi:hypothetical protein
MGKHLANIRIFWDYSKKLKRKGEAMASDFDIGAVRWNLFDVYSRAVARGSYNFFNQR